ATYLQGDRAASRQAYTEAIALSQASGDIFTTILATIGLGNVQEAENQLHQAAETYRRVLHLAGEQPLQIVHEAHLGLARILYEWNDLDAAERHGEQSLQLAQQYDRVIDRFILCEVFLARLKRARGDMTGMAALLAQAARSARQQHFVHRLPEVAAAQVVLLLCQGDLAAAAHLAETHKLAVSRARVHLAQGDNATTLAILEPLRQQAETRQWADERLKVMILQAVAHHEHGNHDEAMQILADTLALAAPGGFIRLFIDEGLPMARLLSAAAMREMMPDYIEELLAAFAAERAPCQEPASPPSAQPSRAQWGQSPLAQQTLAIEPLSQRELEVLRLIAQGLSNHEIGDRLFLALDTVKGHNRRIFDKLQVQRRTEAVARAREWGLL
ncbi:MAG TPA: LuxR C-terminal-related transcriptional regulator, partial [Caldilineaceae bacterium]|nr:LuxR C-terminal-related transcriptional regulator [Caldilineaceae bacterium]